MSRTAGIEKFEMANRHAVMEVDLVNCLLERCCRLPVHASACMQLGTASALDLLDTVALSHSQSSDIELVNRVLAKLGENIDHLAALFRHGSAPVVKRASGMRVFAGFF